jgi:stage II sporulation protein D
VTSREMRGSGPSLGPWIPLLALLSLVAVPQSGCTPKGKAPVPGVPVVRVRLHEGLAQVTVAASNALAIREAPGVNPRPLNVQARQAVLVRRTASGWQVGSLSVDAPELTFLPVGEGGHLSIDGKPYRGDCRLVPAAPGRFDVVNDLDVDSYLKGVVAKELLWDWHIEAYKAQAIVARTYALYELKTAGGGRHWDLHPDERSQVYGGIAGESAKSRAAVDATAGVVVAAGPPGGERIFKAYFSACCGGITQSATDAFNDPPSDALSEQVTGTRCNISPRYTWGPVVLAKDELTRRLRAWGAARGRPEKDLVGLDAIEIAHANRYGRPVRFFLHDTRGQRYHISGTDLRTAINANAPKGTTVYSSFFNPSNEPAHIRFVDGHGFGHGVGMCQWCAQAQADRGTRHEDIVRDAFPGSSLQRAY